MKRSGTRRTLRAVTFAVATLFFASVFSTSLVAAEDEAREWVDSTGKHKITATLVLQTEDKVKLRREDGRLIDMPIDRLSAKDRAFLKGESDNPFEAGLIDESDDAAASDEGASEASGGFRISGRQVSLPGVADKIYVGESELTNSLVAATGDVQWTYRPKKLSPTRKDGVQAFPLKGNSIFGKTSFFTRHSLVFDAANPNAVYAGLPSIDQNGESYVAKCDLQKGVLSVAVLPFPETTIRDVSPDGNYALSIVGLKVGSFTKKGFLALTPIDELGSKKTLDRSKLFSPNYKEEYATDILKATKFSEISDAYWVDAASLLTRTDDGVVTLWDLAKGRAVYSRNVGGDAIVLAPERKAYVTANDGAVCVYNVADGKALGRVSLSDSNAEETTFSGAFGRPAAAFSPDGLKLAVVGAHSIVAVDMEKGEKLTSIMVDTLTKDVVWGSDDYLIVDSVGYDLKSGLPVCRYTGLNASGNLVNALGQVWGLTNDQTIVSFDAPHAAARKAMQGIKPDDFFDLYPGCAVSIKFDLHKLNDQKEVEKYLKDRIEKSGFKYDPKSKIAVVANCVDTGRTEEITVTEIESRDLIPRPILGPRFSRADDRIKEARTMDLKVFAQSVVIEKNGKEIWAFGKETIGPDNLQRDENKTIEEQVKESNKPEVDFFRFAPLPRYVAKSGKGAAGAAMVASVTSAGVK